MDAYIPLLVYSLFANADRTDVAPTRFVFFSACQSVGIFESYLKAGLRTYAMSCQKTSVCREGKYGDTDDRITRKTVRRSSWLITCNEIEFALEDRTNPPGLNTMPLSGSKPCNINNYTCDSMKPSSPTRV